MEQLTGDNPYAWDSQVDIGTFQQGATYRGRLAGLFVVNDITSVRLVEIIQSGWFGLIRPRPSLLYPACRPQIWALRVRGLLFRCHPQWKCG